MNSQKIICLGLLLSLVTSMPVAAMRRSKSTSNLDNAVIEADAHVLNNSASPACDIARNAQLLELLKANKFVVEPSDEFGGICTVEVDVASTLKEQQRKYQQEQERQNKPQEKEERILRKKSAFRWGLFGFFTHLSAGLGIKYIANTYKRGGKLLQSLANSFITKPAFALVYFSQYAALKSGNMLSDIIRPAKKELIDTVKKELRPELNGILKDAKGQVDGFINKLVKKMLPEAIAKVDNRIERRVDDLVEKTLPKVRVQAVGLIDDILKQELPVAKAELNNMVGEIIVENTPKLTKTVNEIAKNATEGAWTGLFGRKKKKNGNGGQTHESKEFKQLQKTLSKFLSETENVINDADEVLIEDEMEKLDSLD